jgi:hypothetical protein
VVSMLLKSCGISERILTEHGTVVCVTHINSWSNISLQPTRIISKSAIGTRRSTIKSTNGAQVDRHVSERTSLDEAPSNPGRYW